MTGDKELLEYMNESVTVGLEALKTLSKELESTDNKIKSNVDKSLEAYTEFLEKIHSMIDPIPTIKQGNLIGVIMAKMGSKKEFMKDNSDSKIAETLIQGYNMGILDITKKMRRYKKDTSKEVMKLAEDYKKMQETGIKDIKGFL